MRFLEVIDRRPDAAAVGAIASGSQHSTMRAISHRIARSLDAIRQLITAGLSMLGGGAAKRAKREYDLARESAPVKGSRKPKD